MACMSAVSTATEQTAFEERAFIAGKDSLVTVYQPDMEGELHEAKAVARGTEVILRDEAPVELEGLEYSRVFLLDGKDDEGSGKIYLVKSSNLTDKKSEVVREKESYVRTPVTI